MPNRLNVEPRYDQKTIKDLAKPNELYQILSPNQGDQGVWIHQDAWFFLGEFDDKKEISYQLKKPGNVIYILVIEGSLNLENQELTKRDAIGISETNSINFTVKKQSKILLMEVPL